MGVTTGRRGLGLALVAAAALLLGGCGYPADPLPPALNRPTRVTDLAAVERGTRIVITFTQPAKTTEDLPIKGGSTELRIGAIPDRGFDLPDWERTSDVVMGREIDAAKYYGKTVAIAVRVKGPRGQSAGWSNFVTLPVVPALAAPEGLEAHDAPDAVRLNWHGAAPGFRVYRKLPAEKEWTQAGTSAMPSYTDTTIEYGQTYSYYVQATDGKAESEISKPVEITPKDTFPPAVPSGVTVAPGTRTIELLWDRNTEKDLAGYSVYRDGMKIANALQSPAYSDRDVKPGVKYSYQITATDMKGNESARSGAFEALIP